MGLLIPPRHLARLRQVVILAARYGGAEMMERAGLGHLLGEREKTPAEPPRASRLVADLERLGPTFVKLGQVLSSRHDLLPPDYAEALEALQDRVEPVPFEEVRRVVEEELGGPLRRFFRRFETSPLAAASLGQVHRALLPGEREVAVKVQRPGVRRVVTEDLEALMYLAEATERTPLGRRLRLAQLVEEFRTRLLNELDYRREARNMELLAKVLGSYPSIVIPRPVEERTTERVLTMEYVAGRRIGTVGASRQIPEGGGRLARELFQAYLHQILVEGFYHADPHPGNILLAEDQRLILLDLGLVGRLSPTLQDGLLKLLLAIACGDGERAAEEALRIGDPEEECDQLEYRRRIASLISRHREAPLEELQMGRLVLEVVRVAWECRLRVPPELTVLGKTLCHLDDIGRRLDPAFQPNQAIRGNLLALIDGRTARSLDPLRLYPRIMEGAELAEELPSRLNRILDRMATNTFRIQLDLIKEYELFTHIDKIANRICAGLVLASLVIGASIMLHVDHGGFTLFGYPGIAILTFLGAAAGGFYLVWTVLWQDRRRS